MQLRTAQRSAHQRLRAILMTLGLVLGSLTGLIITSTPAAAATGNILPPFSTGETWSVCEGYNHGTHTGTSAYGLDLVKNASGSCDNSSAGATVKAPIAGSVYYYQASYGNLCINIAGGRSYTLTHITSSITSGSVTAGQTVGSVGSAGMYNNNGVAHIHFQMWSASGCYNSSVMPFDTADGARICGAPDMTSSGPSGGNGTWSKAAFTGQTCGASVTVTNKFYLNNNFDTTHDILTTYGDAGDQALYGDWNGDGVTTLGVRIGNVYFLNNTFDGTHDFTVTYGDPDILVVSGDWDGNGTETLGVRYGNTFYLDNGFDGVADIVTSYGAAGDNVVVGDWDGNGTDTLGVQEGNKFYLNNNFDTTHDILTTYGDAGNWAAAGDWNGDGIDTLVVRQGNTYYLNNNFDGSADIVTSYGGSNDHPLVGDWNGDGIDTIGIREVDVN